MAEEKSNVYENARYFSNLIYRALGVGVLSFLYLLISKTGFPNIAVLVFYIWLILYFLFSGNFVRDIKKRQHWSKAKRDICVAVIRAPMTALNLFLIFLRLSGDFKMPALLWVCLIAAWSMMPVNELIDYMERKQCL